MMTLTRVSAGIALLLVASHASTIPCASRSLCSKPIPVPSGVNTSASAGVPISFGEDFFDLQQLVRNISTGIPLNSTTAPVLAIYANASLIPAAWDSLAARVLAVEHNSVLNVINALNFSRHTGPNLLAEYTAASSPSDKAAIDATFKKLQQDIGGNQAADEIVLGSALNAVHDLNTGLVDGTIASLNGFRQTCQYLPDRIQAANATYAAAETNLTHCSPSNTTCIAHWKAEAAKALAQLHADQETLGLCKQQDDVLGSLLNVLTEFSFNVQSNAANTISFISSDEKDATEDLLKADLSSAITAKIFLTASTTQFISALSFSIPSVTSGCATFCGYN